MFSVPDASDKRHYVGLYISLFNEFIARIERGEPGGEWVDEAFQSVEVIEACYQSARTGRTVKMDFASSVAPMAL